MLGLVSRAFVVFTRFVLMGFGDILLSANEFLNYGNGVVDGGCKEKHSRKVRGGSARKAGHLLFPVDLIILWHSQRAPSHRQKRHTRADHAASKLYLNT